jgi:hypothetical protein
MICAMKSISFALVVSIHIQLSNFQRYLEQEFKIHNEKISIYTIQSQITDPRMYNKLPKQSHIDAYL